eukprot:scaffold9516_cov92-Cylindrotheca_fusiformis.AAC.3
MMDGAHVEESTNTDAVRIIWEQVKPILAKNNEAVALMKTERYDEALLSVSSALAALNRHVKKLSSEFLSSPASMSDTEKILEHWMALSWNHETPDLSTDSLFLVRDGIQLSCPTSSIRIDDKTACFKAIVLAIFFNQGLVYHLSHGSKSLTDERRQHMVGNAEKMYALALKYCKKMDDENTYNGDFLLACCNNIAVLKYQSTSNCFPAESVNRDMVTRFEYLKSILCLYPIPTSSTVEEVKLWNLCMGNVVQVLSCVFVPSFCAAAA